MFSPLIESTLPTYTTNNVKCAKMCTRASVTIILFIGTRSVLARLHVGTCLRSGKFCAAANGIKENKYFSSKSFWS